MIGFRELPLTIHEKRVSDRDMLLQQSDEIIEHLNQAQYSDDIADADLIHLAVRQYEPIYDEKHGGFGRAPKFPIGFR